MTEPFDENCRLPTWSEMHSDTASWAEELQIRFCREAPAWRKLEIVADLTKGMLELAQTGLRDRYPKASPEEIRRLLADMVLGPELAAKVYGPCVDWAKEETANCGNS